MKRLEPNSPEMQSADVVADNIAHLKPLFPEAFAAEGKIDFDVLKQLLGGEVDDREERYGLNWHGKRKAAGLLLVLTFVAVILLFNHHATDALEISL